MARGSLAAGIQKLLTGCTTRVQNADCCQLSKLNRGGGGGGRRRRGVDLVLLYMSYSCSCIVHRAPRCTCEIVHCSDSCPCVLLGRAWIRYFASKESSRSKLAAWLGLLVKSLEPSEDMHCEYSRGTRAMYVRNLTGLANRAHHELIR